ncbi:hypothetical protein PR048_022963 [Dryococelus australis]|uniref:Uncharacterized protein n=1 Tax=Dryococelus australis TaxID=614101 RepID=A0ABQ9GSU2_9NEOP|nr:hypothetical protein PR048_022963 [Dryococelus australis]
MRVCGTLNHDVQKDITWDDKQLSHTLKVQNIWNLCKLKFHNHVCLHFLPQKVIHNNHLCLDVVDILP